MSWNAYRYAFVLWKLHAVWWLRLVTHWKPCIIEWNQCAFLIMWVTDDQWNINADWFIKIKFYSMVWSKRKAGRMFLFLYTMVWCHCIWHLFCRFVCEIAAQISFATVGKELDETRLLYWMERSPVSKTDIWEPRNLDNLYIKLNFKIQ